MKAAAALVLLLAGCGSVAPAPPPAAAAPNVLAPRLLASRVPQRADLQCFPCHAQLKFEKGPRFPHAISAHKNAGHCHLCHVGTGHHGREIDRTACLTCHEEGSEQLARLARSDTSRK